jgi:hypothetical protein
MRLTIIEPHEHFEVLMRWIKICSKTAIKVQVITATVNWDKLKQLIPKACRKCEHYTLTNTSPIQNTDFIVFTSMQNYWWKWIKYARQYPSALVIHNGNTYFKPFNNLAQRQYTGFTFFKYNLKYLFEQFFNFPIRRDFLEAQNYVLPFSSTQIEFLRKNSPKDVALLIPRYRQLFQEDKMPVVLLSIYGGKTQIDSQFLKAKLLEYKSEKYQQVIILSSLNDFNELKPKLTELRVKHLNYPLSPTVYYSVLKKCKYVCLPFRRERVFNIFKETLGITKYSGRIRDALEYGCEIHMPDYIPREDPEEMPDLEGAVEQMKSMLEELYTRAIH